jgi:plasmid maintenance system antidote protein VapI
MKIERIITNRLKEMGRTQMWLAEQLGVSRQQVSQFLNGSNAMSLPRFVEMLRVLRLEIRPKE